MRRLTLSVALRPRALPPASRRSGPTLCASSSQPTPRDAAHSQPGSARARHTLRIGLEADMRQLARRAGRHTRCPRMLGAMDEPCMLHRTAATVPLVSLTSKTESPWSSGIHDLKSSMPLPTHLQTVHSTLHRRAIKSNWRHAHPTSSSRSHVGASRLNPLIRPDELPQLALECEEALRILRDG